MDRKIERNTTYWLSFTMPMYDRQRHTFLPDNFRFVEPDIVLVRFGGVDKERARCVVCGRWVGKPYKFLDMVTFQEFHMSRHCFNHPSTKLWPEHTKVEDIKAWYQRVDLKQSKSPLARLALMFEEMEHED